MSLVVGSFVGAGAAVGSQMAQTSCRERLRYRAERSGGAGVASGVFRGVVGGGGGGGVVVGVVVVARSCGALMLVLCAWSVLSRCRGAEAAAAPVERRGTKLRASAWSWARVTATTDRGTGST